MATIKHISSKNANYGAAEEYLCFEHDEFSGKEIRDANGHLIPRKDYRIDTLLCGEDDFAIACMKANLRFGKNNQRGDVKSHHYIISYDPRDAVDHGLTMDQAQRMGIAFCMKNFPGHQAMIVTHPDGHNHSGNIHTHIVINSLRIEDVPMLDYMDRPGDTKAGMKHRCTSACFRYLRAEVMEMCQQNGLYQIDLLGGSRERVTEKEYWSQRRGQQKLADNIIQVGFSKGGNVTEENASVLNKPVTQSKFETEKEKLRQTIRTALSTSRTLDEFTERLLQLGVTVRESRGRFSYLTADRTKPITSRRLGDDYSKDAILAQLERNAMQNVEIRANNLNAEDAPEQMNPTGVKSAQYNRKSKLLQENAPEKQKVQRIIDLDQKLADGKGEGYIQWGKKHNLRQIAGSMAFLSQHHIKNWEELEVRCAEAITRKENLAAQIKSIEVGIRDRKELIGNLRNHWNYKVIYSQMQEIRNEKKRTEYYETHRAEIVKFEAANRYFKEKEITKLPSVKNLQAEIDQLYSEKNGLYQQYNEAKAWAKELDTIRRNIDDVTRNVYDRVEKNKHFRE